MLRHDTPIATPAGWTSVARLKPGDAVFDSTGHPAIVASTGPLQHPSEAYRVSFDDGASLETSACHQLHTLTRHERVLGYKRTDHIRALNTGYLLARRRAIVRFPRPVPHTEAEAARRAAMAARGRAQRLLPPTGALRSIGEIAESIDILNDRATNHSLPVAEPLALATRPLPCDPYTVGRHLVAPHLLVGELLAQWETPAGPRPDPEPNGLLELGVLSRPHIPADYLRASADQRLRLLQGLMDATGCYNPVSRHCELWVDRCELTEDVYDLVLSLGHKAWIKTAPRSRRGRRPAEWNRISWSPRTDRPAPFSSQALLATLPGHPHPRARTRRIVACDRIEAIPMRRVAVDSPSGLFLAGRHLIPSA